MKQKLDTEQKIMACVNRNKYLPTNKIVEKCGLTKASICPKLRELRERDLLERKEFPERIMRRNNQGYDSSAIIWRICWRLKNDKSEM